MPAMKDRKFRERRGAKGVGVLEKKAGSIHLRQRKTNGTARPQRFGFHRIFELESAVMIAEGLDNLLSLVMETKNGPRPSRFRQLIEKVNQERTSAHRCQRFGQVGQDASKTRAEAASEKHRGKIDFRFCIHMRAVPSRASRSSAMASEAVAAGLGALRR